MQSQRPKREKPFSLWLLRRADQAAVGLLVAACLGSMAGWWISQGGLEGRLVEVDRAQGKTAHFEVDINRADWPELTQLPTIGETLARRIVQSRQRSGPFRDLDDLRRVRGIGPKTLETVRPYLRPMPSQRAVAGN
jgi:competence protein ComEA